MKTTTSIALLVLALLGALPVTPTSSSGASMDAGSNPMLVVDVEDLSVEEQLTFASLQGIVNRTEPTLYLVGIRSAQDFPIDPSAEDWLADVVDVPFERVEPDEALLRLGGTVAGMVVWDPAIPYESQNVATTIAGRDDLLPVSPGAADRLGDLLGLEVEVDLRDLGLTTSREMTEWAITELEPPPGGWSFPVWTGRPRNANAIQPGLRDWAVANRAFVFDADPASEPGLLRKVMDLFPRGTGVYGYLFFDTPGYYASGVPLNEALGVGELTEAGNWLIPTTDAVNLSVHVLSDEPVLRAPWNDAPRTPDPDKTYVSFVVSDGDAVGYMQTLARSLQVERLGASSIPIGLSTSALLADVAPAIWNWYIENMPDNARLVAGPSGAGHLFPSLAPEADLDRFLDHTAAKHAATSLRSTWIMNTFATPSPTAAVAGRFVDALDPALLYADYTPGAPISPVVSYVDGVPMVRTVMARNAAEIAPAIEAARSRQADGPRFVSIGLVTWGANADDAKAALEQFGPDVVAVAPDEFAGLLQGASAAGYRGSSDVVGPVAPAVGACRADLEQVRYDGTPVVGGVLANSLFGADLPADVSLDVDSTGVTASFDATALAQKVIGVTAGIGAAAYGPTAAATFAVDVEVTGLELPGVAQGAPLPLAGDIVGAAAADGTGTDGPSTARAEGAFDLGDRAEVRGTLSFTVSFDPGDGTKTANVVAPLACIAAVSSAAPTKPGLPAAPAVPAAPSAPSAPAVPAVPQGATPNYTG